MGSRKISPDDLKLEGVIASVCSDIAKKQAECKRLDKHKEETWFPYFISNNSSYTDQVKGICSYCKTPLERPLNNQEHQELELFYELVKQPFTI